MVVIDASAAVCLLGGIPSERVAEVALRLAQEEIHAPHLLDVEVAHTLRRLVMARTITPQRANEALDDLASMAIRRHAHLPLIVEIWRMRDNRTAYDAAYVALAELLGIPLITLDARMARTPANIAIEVF